MAGAFFASASEGPDQCYVCVCVCVFKGHVKPVYLWDASLARGSGCAGLSSYLRALSVIAAAAQLCSPAGKEQL